MGKYIIKRILWLIPVILGVSILIFTIMYFVPGDPAAIILGTSATQQQIEDLRESMGLNDAYIVQLGRFLSDTFLKFDLGTSYVNSVAVSTSLLQRFPQTLIIALVSCFLQIIIGIPLGVTAAVHHNKWQDRVCVVGSMIGISIPNFWLASMLILLFAFHLGWLPAFGIDSWKSYILPCFCAALPGIATECRYTRTYMLEQIRSDYVVTARAKGLHEGSIRYGHALPNTLIPLITGIGGSLGAALGGTVIIENVFSIPGVGQYMVNAIGNRDYPVVRGSVVVLSILFSLIMLLVDIAYSYIDPRIKAQYVGRSKKKARKVESNA
ncbi:MAG: ABC transporter permease [Lachnospiraceae bacterium]|nr:ABC transporter permease [Lachnospiraceae bacterium]